MDLTCDCGRISWKGAGDTFVEGTQREHIHPGSEWRPGEEWRCTHCGHVVERKSPRQLALDAAVQQRLPSW